MMKSKDKDKVEEYRVCPALPIFNVRYVEKQPIPYFGHFLELSVAV